jgi:hypothetical protein
MTARPRTRAGRDAGVRAGPQVTDAHEVVFYRSTSGDMPGRDYLRSCPLRIAARLRAVVVAVAEAPPTRFAGGGLWEAMHGEMAGWFEVRVDGAPNRTHYRLFCLIDTQAVGAGRPYLVVVDGRTKPFRTTLADREYAAVRRLGEHYRATQPRPIG